MLINIFKKPEILNKELHKDLKMGTYKDYSFTKDAFLVPLGLNELQTAMKSLIIVFIKEQNGDIYPSAVLGGEEGGNLLLDKDGKWKENTYIPAALRCYPFGLGGNEKEKFITVDSEATVFDDKEGKALIDEKLEITKDGEHAFSFVQNVYSQIEEAKKIGATLDSYGILKQAQIEIEKGETKHTLTKGIYIIDENSFNKLESRKIKKLATQGMIKNIYASLFSLSNRY